MLFFHNALAGLSCDDAPHPPERAHQISWYCIDEAAGEAHSYVDEAAGEARAYMDEAAVEAHSYMNEA